MTRSHVLTACSATLALTLACGGQQVATGDAEKGRQAFIDLRCNSCHEVAGETLPPPSVTPAVSLGGRFLLPPSPERIKEDILLPSSHFALGYPREQIMQDDVSRMPDYSNQLTDDQVANLVAFLKSRYVRGVPSATR